MANLAQLITAIAAVIAAIAALRNGRGIRSAHNEARRSAVVAKRSADRIEQALNGNGAQQLQDESSGDDTPGT